MDTWNALTDVFFRFLEHYEIPVPVLTRQTRLVEDLGLDSLRLIELFIFMEDELGAEFVPGLTFRTLGDVADYVAGKVTSGEER